MKQREWIRHMRDIAGVQHVAEHNGDGHIPVEKKRHLADQWLEMRLSPLNEELRVDRGTIVGERRRKICIYGAGHYGYMAPLDDPDWEVWSLNLCVPYDAERRLRADLWFDLHQRVAQSPDDLRWIAACPFPIYLPPDLMDASPNAVAYPLTPIEETLGSYFTCTFAFQLALILFEKRATDVGLFGVELAFGTLRERTVEWACTAYWLGRVEQSGIQIHLPAKSSLGQHFDQLRYGFDYREELAKVQAYVDAMRIAVNPDDVPFIGTVEGDVT